MQVEEQGSAPGAPGDSCGDLARCRGALRDALEELERARQHIALFAAQVSHDLRTPLTAVRANAEMLAGEPTVAADSELAWMVAAIERGARRMDVMIEQMLTYAREGGRPALSATPLGTVFEQAVQDLAPVIREKHARLTIGALPTVSADGGQLHAVALALLSNALRFHRPDETPRVVVQAARCGDHWRVTVSDNGIGVTPERREAMFVLFAREDKRIEGHGVGLATAKRVVEAHGGRIGMEAGPDGGTTVWFDLPV